MTTLSLDRDHQVIIINPDVMPEADEFDFWGRIFLHQDEISLGEFSQGADRHMLRFHYCNCPFELHFEHYGDNLWIAASGAESELLLEKLTHYLSAS
ncbi:DUF3630 family protein [Pseudoalteromonas sp. T1lg75]|uniref:DUF3630 family protein n=1 Tax=Pseudoalteromonas sp. T1lg75 TaxID=2077102 RepID=UPI000CF738F8|nr:DUF3630 family protein [Pseudoalteromonas sp. T1lg75]